MTSFSSPDPPSPELAALSLDPAPRGEHPDDHALPFPRAQDGLRAGDIPTAPVLLGSPVEGIRDCALRRGLEVSPGKLPALVKAFLRGSNIYALFAGPAGDPLLSALRPLAGLHVRVHDRAGRPILYGRLPHTPGFAPVQGGQDPPPAKPYDLLRIVRTGAGAGPVQAPTGFLKGSAEPGPLVPVLRRPAGTPSAPVPEEVYSGRILRDGRLIAADVGIAGEGIVAVKVHLAGGKRHDLGEQVLLPSAVDLHVHFRDPGPPGAGESFDTGTLQAAYGGVGAVVDMPNTLPPVDSLDHLDEKEGLARGRSRCDVLLYAALLPRTPVEALGGRAAGFKLYLSPTTGDLPIPSWEELPALLERVAATRLPLHVHAEDPDAFGDLPSARDARAWDRARPASSEERAISRLLPGPPSLKLHLAHLTTRKGVELARTSGVSAEVTPQHLLLSAPASPDGRWKVNPPLREEGERAALYGEFAQGRVPMVASDHAPHPLVEKERPFPLAPAGMPGVETAFPLLLAKVRNQELALPTLVEAFSERPARFLGLPRGGIAPGLEADLIAVDFRALRRIRADGLHAPGGWTPFEGFPGIFPTLHLLRGELLLSGGEYVGSPHGRILRPGDLPPPQTVRPLTGLPTEEAMDRT